MAKKPSILFACVHNAGRSQIAAGLASLIAGDRVDVRSGGSEPADAVHENVALAMAELGIDITAEKPRLLTDDLLQPAHVIVTMGCGEECPVLPGKRYLDWEIEDPAGKPLTGVRRIRGQIRLRVEGLLRELGA